MRTAQRQAAHRDHARLGLTIDHDVVLCGVLFSFAMGRLGGLLPSLSAMRLGILDSLM